MKAQGTPFKKDGRTPLVGQPFTHFFPIHAHFWPSVSNKQVNTPRKLLLQEGWVQSQLFTQLNYSTLHTKFVWSFVCGPHMLKDHTQAGTTLCL